MGRRRKRIPDCKEAIKNKSIKGERIKDEQREFYPKASEA